MYKKFFAFMATVAMFSACGSQDVPDETPILIPPPDYSDYEPLDVESNNSQDKANSIGRAKLSQGIKFKGILKNEFETDDNGRPVLVLDEDYYKIDLMYDEIISITASNASNISSPFRVKFYSLCPRDDYDCTEKTIDVVNQTNSLKETTKKGDFQSSDSFDSKTTFYIKVSNVGSASQYPIYNSIPYAIIIKSGQ